MKQKYFSTFHLSAIIGEQPSSLQASFQSSFPPKPKSSVVIQQPPHSSSVTTVNPQHHKPAKNNHNNHVEKQRSTCELVSVSIDSEIQQNIYGKMEKLLNRTNNLEKKLHKKGGDTPKPKGLISKYLAVSNKSIKGYQKQFQNQQQAPPLPFKGNALESLNRIWEFVMGKEVDSNGFQDDCRAILEKVSGWKMQKEKFQSYLENVRLSTRFESVQELIHSTNYDPLENSTMASRQEEIRSLTQRINCLQSQKSCVFSQESTINRPQRSSSFLNSSYSTCFSPSNKRHDSILLENASLRQSIFRLQIEKSQLTQTLEFQVLSIKETISQEIESKLQLTRDLIAAQNYILQLKKTNELQTATLQQIIDRERESMERFMQSVKAEAMYKGCNDMKRLDQCVSLSMLQSTIQEEIKSSEYLGCRLQEAKEVIAGLEQEKRFVLSEIERINEMVREYQERKTNQEGNGQIDKEIVLLSSGVRDLIGKYKVLKQQMRGKAAPFHEIQQGQTAKSSASSLINSRFQNFYSNESKLNRRKAIDIQSLQKQNKRKPFERVPIPLDRSDRAQAQTGYNALKFNKQSNATSVEAISPDTSTQHQHQHPSNLFTSTKNKPSLFLQSLNNSHSMQEQSMSEISECWKECSSIKNFAMKIDDQLPGMFQIEELFESYNLSGEIPTIIKSFVKKIADKIGLDGILGDVQTLLNQLKNVLELEQFDKMNQGEFMREQLGKMQCIFDEVNMERRIDLGEIYYISEEYPETQFDMGQDSFPRQQVLNDN